MKNLYWVIWNDVSGELTRSFATPEEAVDKYLSIHDFTRKEYSIAWYDDYGELITEKTVASAD